MCSHYLAEIEPDVKAFQSDADLASWAGLCPESYESADIKKSSHITQGIDISQAGFDHVGID